MDLGHWNVTVVATDSFQSSDSDVETAAEQRTLSFFHYTIGRERAVPPARLLERGPDQWGSGWGGYPLLDCDGHGINTLTSVFEYKIHHETDLPISLPHFFVFFMTLFFCVVVH
jgi:hypothetical protein